MATLITQRPSSNRVGLPRRFDDLFEGFFHPISLFEETVSDDLIPAMDVKENDEDIVITAELPGIKKDDIEITLENGVLTISAESKSETEEKEGEKVVRQERRYGKYVRSMRLGTEIDESKIKADYKDGILALTLPKAEEVKPKKITVDVK